MSYIRDVGRWLQAHGRGDAYVLSDRWKAPVVPAHPYLLSSQEIELFFAAAATMNAGSPWRWQAVAFFTLMHSCGLRTGETRLLRPGRCTCDDRAHRRRVVQGQPLSPAAADQRGHRCPGRLRPDDPRAVRPRGARFSSPRPATRSPRRPSGRSSAVSGTRRAGPAGGRSAAAAVRFPAPLRLRQRRKVDGAGQRTSPRCCPTCRGTWGTRASKQLLLHPHLARLHGRLRRHHPAASQSLLPEVGFG